MLLRGGLLEAEFWLAELEAEGEGVELVFIAPGEFPVAEADETASVATVGSILTSILVVACRVRQYWSKLCG